jgi:hypothetical protein
MVVMMMIMMIHELNFTVDTLYTALRKLCGA